MLSGQMGYGDMGAHVKKGNPLAKVGWQDRKNLGPPL